MSPIILDHNSCSNGDIIKKNNKNQSPALLGEDYCFRTGPVTFYPPLLKVPYYLPQEWSLVFLWILLIHQPVVCRSKSDYMSAQLCKKPRQRDFSTLAAQNCGKNKSSHSREPAGRSGKALKKDNREHRGEKKQRSLFS